MLSGRREQEGEETADLIRRSSSESLFVRSDVSSEAEVKALIEKTVEWIALRMGIQSRWHRASQWDGWVSPKKLLQPLCFCDLMLPATSQGSL